MKSMKKILSAILTVALLAAFITVPVSAAVPQDAQIAETLDILRGEGSGVTEEYLAKNTNRSQGALILLRLMGLEYDALDYEGTATFTDAADATAYWQPMLAYLKANPDVGFQGYPDGTFAPNKVMTAQEIYKVLLVSLGYEENVDFTWGEVFTFAASKGLTALDEVGQINNGHLATALVEAMEANKKDGQKLVEFLIDEGVVDIVDAQAAGLVPMELTITDAFASGSKEITVTLNMAAPTGTAVSLKRGSVTWPAEVEWDSSRKVLKFTRSYNFTSGEYTVKVGNSTKTLTIEDPVLVGIEIGADYIFPLMNQDLHVSFYNQYGEPMTIVGANFIIVNIDKGTSLSAQNMGTTVKVDASDPTKVESGDTLSVNVLKDGMSEVKMVQVYDEPEIQSLYIAGVDIADDATVIEENTSGHKLLLEATDQYGNAYTLTAADIQPGGQVSFSNSNENVLPSSSFYIDAEGNLGFSVLESGTANLAILVPMAGIVRTYTINVSAPAQINTISVHTGSGMITSGTRYDLTTYAYDQQGSPITVKGNFDPSKFTMTTTNQNVVPMGGIQYDSTKGTLFLLPGIPGTATVTYYYNGVYQGSMQIVVYDAPEPQQITSISFPQYFEKGASKQMTLANVVVKDQYGNNFDLDGSDYYIQVERTSGTTMTAGTVLSGTTPSSFSATATEGKTTFTLRVVHESEGAVAGSENGITIEVVDTSDVSSYGFSTVGTMYAGGASMTAYHKTLEIKGKIGTKDVVLAGGPVPSAIELITNSNSDFVLDTNTLELYATDEGTTTIKAWRNGAVVASVNVTASDNVPEVTILRFDETSHTIPNSGTFDVTDILTIKDQYGVDITSSANVYYSSSNSTVATINSDTGLITPVSSGTTNISVVELSGAGSAVLQLTVQ